MIKISWLLTGWKTTDHITINLTSIQLLQGSLEFSFTGLHHTKQICVCELQCNDIGRAVLSASLITIIQVKKTNLN